MQGRMGGDIAVSAVHRRWMKHGALALAVLAVVGLLVFFAMPSRYIFRSEGNALNLCQGRMMGFVGRPLKGYEHIPIGSDAVKALTGRSFSSPEEALAALREILQGEIEAAHGALAPLEAPLAERYRTLLADLQAARIAGMENLDLSIDALDAWLRMYEARSTATAQTTRSD